MQSVHIMCGPVSARLLIVNTLLVTGEHMNKYFQLVVAAVLLSWGLAADAKNVSAANPLLWQ